MTINGETSDLPAGITVRNMLQEKNFIFPLLIIKINGNTIPRDAWNSAAIPENATVDVIHLISGG